MSTTTHDTLRIAKSFEPAQGNVRTLRFADARTAWALALDPFVTFDAGHTWKMRSPSGFERERLSPRAIRPISSTECWLLANYADKDLRCFHTVDAGLSWEEKGRFFPDKYNIVWEDVFFSDASHGWILFAAKSQSTRFHCRLCKTTDTGSKWSCVSLKFRGRPQRMIFADRSYGWIAEVQPNKGRSQYKTVIHSTTDEGLSWNAVSELSAKVVDFCIASNGNLFCCGGEGLIAKSADGGRTWEVVSTSTNMTLEAIDFHGTVGVAAGTSDYIRSRRSVAFLLTRDEGRSWKRIESPMRASIVGVHLTAWDRGVIATGEGLYQFRLA